MKRMDNNYDNSKSKRIKLQIDDIWGDDPAIEEVDRCIDLATQICSQQKQGPSTNTQDDTNNYSIINYECFKEKSNIVASTQLQLQLQHNVSASISKIHLLENEKKKLLEENETKNGEIAFLRAQLKQSQNVVSKEKMERLKILQQNQETWNEKFNAQNKEVASLKCENELKNLETINLRQKLTELKKIYNCNITILNEEQPQLQQQQQQHEQQQVKSKNFDSYSYKNICYPCKEILLDFKENFNAIDATEFSTLPILKVANYTEDELNTSEEFHQFIIKLEKYTREYLINFLIKLIKSKSSQINDNKCNSFYLNTTDTVDYDFENLFSVKKWSEFEIATDIRRLIATVAYLCQHSAILYNFLKNQLINNNYKNNTYDVENIEFLEVILQIVVNIKKFCLTEQLCGVLASTLKLLIVLVDREILPTANSYNFIFRIFKEILFAQPNEPVLQYICHFLKFISVHDCFMSMLCTKKKSNQTQINDGLLYFSDETCTIKVLISIIETCKLEIATASHLMHFLQNLVTCNVDWMYRQNYQTCGCLSDIYGLGIKILYKLLEQQQQELKSYNETFLSIFHVGLLFLHVLTVRIPELVAKSSRLYAQYQTIINYMSKMKDELLLTNVHETMLDNLISQLNNDTDNNSDIIIQNTETETSSIIFNCNFINF